MDPMVPPRWLWHLWGVMGMLCVFSGQPIKMILGGVLVAVAALGLWLKDEVD